MMIIRMFYENMGLVQVVTVLNWGSHLCFDRPVAIDFYNSLVHKLV